MPASGIEVLTEQLAAYLPADEVDAVRRAHAYGAHAHAGQQRKTGEPYIAHPLAVAGILANLRVDVATLCAALLHDVIEDTAATRTELAEQFGDEVAGLVDAVTKLTQIRFETREQAQAAYFRKMMLAVAGDLRVILIKLADRLHNMRTLSHLAPQKRRRIARETLEIYAPIANRLGMHELCSELEELGFSALYPLRSRVLEQALRRARGNRHDVVGKIEATLRLKLDAASIPYRLESREKHLYSVYQKMRQDRIPLSEVYDVYALRIVVHTVDECYRVLGLVHSTFKPLPQRFKDYIAIPKTNGYQSLHTALFTPYGVPAEIQIRTEEMDRIANAGIAAHWLYKDPSGGNSRPQQRAREWLQGLVELQRNAGDPQEFLDSVKVDLFPDEVYVFTPKGRILALPAGATAVDFAYAVHSDIGNHCVAVRIERRLAPLSSVLETGQTVEVITARTATPHPSWLNFVVTGKARAAIRHFLKTIDHERAVDLGRRLLEIELARLGTPMAQVPEANIAGVLREFSAKAMDDLLEDVGLGKRLAAVVATHLVSGTPLPAVGRRQRSGLRRALQRVAPRWLVGSDSGRAPLAIKGTEGLVVSYGKCCRPIPGDPIRGYVSAGRGVVIHVDGCPSTAEFAKQPDKWLDVEWQPAGDARFPVDIRIEVVDQRGELATLAAAIADMDCNIANVLLHNRDGIHAVDDFTIEVRDRVHLARIMKRLRTLKSVRRITRKRG
ncbi:MAG TPA: guanosine-3',5'-bis(diphosphate) 3'-diphosphatase [Gammaproteobacteria bacterium]|uniref:RelA/SpoT family protein n=1 Tax=Immundisolibacter sp. TaxID=1934948 RepID=UPI000E96537F|nr:guanosine-3',5'-bis(diphosphate) 3'-diphosphatase [Gammaproteobacteria bacterium]HCZ48986.1 guanosine-3',5'-bis(diphosphate) 3'-diphosphatase [Gammaproteobacteria bacterium]MCH78424.1 guanosine-3',5'-bis(diphosphate) 3'-diphosphatase [Gammaproteobacteria bacterium]